MSLCFTRVIAAGIDVGLTVEGFGVFKVVVGMPDSCKFDDILVALMILYPSTFIFVLRRSLLVDLVLRGD